ncbi:hypothetical protein BT96DRAFT_948614 [Gymnopus androsaceus JB14]|uniref:CxC5 like cysteine cluster associated with KDZ domain-containing protein n=1 Tax=Gymnopus androsaceus JB14 TaxID=1447944 RepID=A0A6A4GP61_9AGAR|nr:hypothetical protein BT96DRAFT_948614 [Gymnopus androsaceus JB14]
MHDSELQAARALNDRLILFILVLTKIKDDILMIYPLNQPLSKALLLLPLDTIVFLSRSCNMSERDVEICWKVVKVIVWNADDALHSIIGDANLLEQTLYKNGSALYLSPTNLWSQTHVCTNKECKYIVKNKGLKLQGAWPHPAVLYTQDRGPIAVVNHHITCHGCRWIYHHDFIVAPNPVTKNLVCTYYPSEETLPTILQIDDHQFVETKLLKIWRNRYRQLIVQRSTSHLSLMILIPFPWAGKSRPSYKLNIMVNPRLIIAVASAEVFAVHQGFSQVCRIVGCSEPIEQGFKMCENEQHCAAEGKYNEAGQAAIQLKKRFEHSVASATAEEDDEELDIGYEDRGVAEAVEGAFSLVAKFTQETFTGCCVPNHVIYDSNCILSKYVRNHQNKELCKFFAKIGLAVDVFHFKCKHKEGDKWCKLRYEANGKMKWFFNTSIAEQRKLERSGCDPTYWEL